MNDRQRVAAALLKSMTVERDTTFFESDNFELCCEVLGLKVEVVRDIVRRKWK